MNLSTEQIATLTLIRTPSIGPVSFRRLVAFAGSAQQALERLPELYRTNKRTCPTPPTSTEIEKEISQLTKLGGTFLFLGAADYPSLLAHIPDPPPVLSILGHAPFIATPQIAIVGNRNASAAGLAFTSTLATELAHAGFSITSGLARGIDTAAHAGALAAQKPTIAVVGGGVDVIYPEENRALHANITAAGCVVSEAPLGAVPTPSLFPRRNRIIAGLSYGVVVTEASRHSGSLITSTCAGEYGREVFAVPGSPSDTRAAGPNHLIKQGATMIESAQDILSILQPQLAFSPQPHTRYTRETHINTTPLALFDEPIAPEPALSLLVTEISPSAAPTERLYHLLGSAPVAVDELIRKSNLPETEVLIALTELDLEGRLTRHANGFLSRA